MKKYLKKVYGSWRATLPYIMMFIIKHIPSKRLRIIILKRGGVKVGNHVSMFASVDIRNLKGLVIENGCSIGPKVLLDARKGIHIHKNVTIAYDAIIWTLHHDMNSTDFKAVGAPVEIGEYAWICSRSIILPGVKIGKGAVVASGAVVTKDVEPYAVVAGIPAKKIGERKEKNLSYQPYYHIHIV